MPRTLIRWFAVALLALAPPLAAAQSLPVRVAVSGNVAKVDIGPPGAQIAAMTASGSAKSKSWRRLSLRIWPMRVQRFK